MCAEFVGHGAFGIITKAAWVPYFALFGMPENVAYVLMPVVGAVDVVVGVVTLLTPRRAVLAYAAFWGFQTACLRPLSGEGMWEFLERAGNFGVPFAFLYLSGFGHSVKEWFSPIRPAGISGARSKTLGQVLRLTTAGLLVGHGGFGLFMQKTDWVRYLGAIGISDPAVGGTSLLAVLGALEIALGLVVLLWPGIGLLLFVFAWKVGTELMRPLTGEPLWEFVERSGSYAAPLALLYLRGWPRSWREWLARNPQAGTIR